MSNDRKHDSIALPAGSYDQADLEKAVDTISKAKDSERDATAADLLEKSRVRVEGEPEQRVPGMIPGHRLQDVEIVRDEGTEVKVGKGKTEVVGRVVENRTIQVFDPELGAEQAEAEAEATAATAGGAETRAD